MVVKPVIKTVTKTAAGKAKAAPTVADASDGELGVFSGTIKSFAYSTWYGFIESEEVTALGYGDVFLNGDELRDYKKGQIVKFKCSIKHGKPVATHLRSGLKEDSEKKPGKSRGKGSWKGGGWNSGYGGDGGGGGILSTLVSLLGGGGGYGGGKGGYKGGGKGGYQHKSNLTKTWKVDDSGGELGEFTGLIKGFDARTWYGFIESEEVTNAGYGDVFLHGNELKLFRKGQTVKFTCVLNKDGKPVATKLKSGLK